MLRKLTIVILAVLMLLQAPLASAADLKSAFNNLFLPGSAASVNSPGRYQSGARNSFIAGGMEMRVPKQEGAPKMFSFTPPRITAGCGGVSAFFGGFSFISGQEFEQLVKGIASGAALGFVTMLVMKTLCPQCADVVQQLKNAAQAASRLAIDACKLGQEAYKKFAGEPTDFTGTLCGATTSTDGMTGDFLSSMHKTCTDIAGSMGNLEKVNPDTAGDSEEAQQKKAELKCKAGTGNVTWNTLGGPNSPKGTDDMGYSRKLLLMNMMGAVLRHGAEPSSCETVRGTLVTDNETNTQIYCSPMVSSKDILGAFMCGTDPNAVTSIDSAPIRTYCSTFFGNGSSQHGSASMEGVRSAKLMVCDNPAKCENLKLMSLDEASLMSGEGFLPQISRTLANAVAAVRNDQAMPDEAIQLMQVAPYPLYQAVNAAAVYPVAAADLLDSISMLVAESAAAAYMEEVLRWEGKDGAAKCTQEEQVRRIIDTLSSTRAQNNARRTLLAQNMAMQDGIREQIRMVNLAVQQQVMTTELLHQNQMAEQLTRAIAPVNAGGTPRP